MGTEASVPGPALTEPLLSGKVALGVLMAILIAREAQDDFSQEGP